MADLNLHVEKLRLHLRGIDPATARASAEGLAEAVARSLDVRALQALEPSVGDMRLGPVALPTDPGAGTVRDAVASAIGRALDGGAASGGGES